MCTHIYIYIHTEYIYIYIYRKIDQSKVGCPTKIAGQRPNPVHGQLPVVKFT